MKKEIEEIKENIFINLKNVSWQEQSKYGVVDAINDAFEPLTPQYTGITSDLDRVMMAFNRYLWNMSYVKAGKVDYSQMLIYSDDFLKEWRKQNSSTNSLRNNLEGSTKSPSLVSEIKEKWEKRCDYIKNSKSVNTDEIFNFFEPYFSTLLVKEGEKDSEDWISVEDRLPDCHSQHGIHFGSGYLLGFTEFKEVEIIQLWECTIDGKSVKKWESSGDDEQTKITHWQPLPNPPKQEQQKTGNNG